jgi:hypothetical protein
MSALDLAEAAALPETPDLEGAYPRLGRTMAIGLGVGFRIVGSRYPQDTRWLRDGGYVLTGADAARAVSAALTAADHPPTHVRVDADCKLDQLPVGEPG